jgi:hypothetical protein
MWQYCGEGLNLKLLMQYFTVCYKISATYRPNVASLAAHEPRTSIKLYDIYSLVVIDISSLTEDLMKQMLIKLI